MLFSNMVNCCVAESFDLLDGYSLDLTIAKDKFKDIQMITSLFSWSSINQMKRDTAELQD